MSVSYKYRVSVSLPAARPAVRSVHSVQPEGTVVARGATGALAGTAVGVAAGVGAAAFVPGVDVAVLVAMGVLFGAFNGSLFGLMNHLNRK